MRLAIAHLRAIRYRIVTALKHGTVGLAIFVFAQTTFAGATMDGLYTGQFNGQPAQASLTGQQGTLSGTLDIGGYVYRMEVIQQGNAADGWMMDQGGVRFPVNLALEESSLLLRVYSQGPTVPPLEFALTRDAGGKAPSSSASTSSAPAAQLDPVLIGVWTKTDSYTSGDFSAASQSSVTLHPDGTYRYGPGRVIGGGDAGSFDSDGGGAGGATGRWRTENRILYTQEAGTGWMPYARYHVEDNKLLLTFGDGSRELWNRR